MELLDELVFGAWTAAWPLIRDDLALTYAQVGVLLSVPHVFGSVLEPPIGLLGDAWNRRALVRAGGVAFVLGLGLVVASGGFGLLLLALMLLTPASGTFVGLSQAALMDLDPRRHEQNMARWALAGSIGVVVGPFAVGAASLVGAGWRLPFGVFAVLTLAALAAVWRLPMPIAGAAEAGVVSALRSGGARALQALRRPDVLRWLTLLQLSDLMLDVLHGFLALYLVDVAGWNGAQAALVVVLWTVVGLAGDVAVIPLLERVEGRTYVRASAAAAIVVFPAFLLVDHAPAKLALLCVLGVLTAGWYPVLQGRLYSSLPGQSATVVALASVFGIGGALLPLAIGLLAQRFGLAPTMWLLLAGPAALVALVAPRRSSP